MLLRHTTAENVGDEIFETSADKEMATKGSLEEIEKKTLQCQKYRQPCVLCNASPISARLARLIIYFRPCRPDFDLNPPVDHTTHADKSGHSTASTKAFVLSHRKRQVRATFPLGVA